MQGPFLFVAHGIHEGFLRACDESLDTVLAVCRFITPTFLSLALLLSIGRGYLSGQGLRMDLSPVVRAVALFLVLFLYRELTGILGAGIKGVTQLFDGTGNVGEALQRLTAPPGMAAAARADAVAPAEVVEQGGAWYARVYSSLANFSLMHLLTEFFTTTTVLLIRQTVLFLRQFVLGFLYVVGPLALSLSAVPAFAGLAGKWLQQFIAVQCWALTMNLLDLIYTHFADQYAGGGPGGLLPPEQAYTEVQFLVMSVAFILLYCLVPTLTGYYIGSTAVQSFVGTMVGLAAGAAGTAGAVAFPPAAGGGASGALGRAMGLGPGGGSSAGFSGSAGAPPMESGGWESPGVRYPDGEAYSAADPFSGGGAYGPDFDAYGEEDGPAFPEPVGDGGDPNGGGWHAVGPGWAGDDAPAYEPYSDDGEPEWYPEEEDE